jgi:hypothetical protein
MGAVEPPHVLVEQVVFAQEMLIGHVGIAQVGLEAGLPFVSLQSAVLLSAAGFHVFRLVAGRVIGVATASRDAPFALVNPQEVDGIDVWVARELLRSGKSRCYLLMLQAVLVNTNNMRLFS